MALPVLPLLIIGAAALFFLSGDGEAKKRPGEEGISPEEMKLLERLKDGSLRYKADTQSVLLPLMALMSNSMQASGPQGPQGDLGFSLVQHPSLDAVPQSQVGATFVKNAYEGAKDLHARGFDVYVTPTLISLPGVVGSAVARVLYAVPAGQPLVSAQFGNAPPVLALLRRANEPWVEEAGGSTLAVS